MLFETVNFVACAFFVSSLIRAAKEYAIPTTFMFWARVISFGFLSAGMMHLVLTKPGFYSFVGVVVSFFASLIMSKAEKVTTLETFFSIASGMFFWPYFVSYLMICMAYYDLILLKVNKKEPKDDDSH
jgi:hypothetical protein